MDNLEISSSFSFLSTPLVADACVRLRLPLRLAPAGILPVIPGVRLSGRALPAKHYGSVDIFLEAMQAATPGDILVIDNGGRTDEGCIGDLTVLEAQAAGLGGLVVWGCHRDSAELVQIRFPVYSYGRCPAGPSRLDPRPMDALQSAAMGDLRIDREDTAFADDDGVLFVAAEHLDAVLSTAHSIWQTERRQAQAIASGRTLRQQLHFEEYLDGRAKDASLTFRKHLRALGGAIEE
jgi:regulator of RNase E activity RraA